MGYRVMRLLSVSMTLALFLVVFLTGCKPERTSDEPRPANAPCERCAPRPTLTPESAR